MAVRNQVLSLFGATPEQIMQQERARQAEFLASQRDPFQSAGAAIGVGLGRLFGGESQEVAQARQMQEAVAGIDPNDPQALRSLAQTVSQFAPERALQIAAYAGELEKSQMPATIDVPTIVGYETEPDIDPTTGLQRLDANKNPMFKRNPVYRNVPFERTPDGLRSLVPGYSLPTGASAAVKDDLDTPATPDAPVPDYITNEQGVVVPNPAKTAQATDQQQPSATAQPQATAEPFVPQQGRMLTQAEFEAMQANTTGAGVAPRGDNTSQAVPSIARALPQGELTYADPEALIEASNALRDQITKLEKSKDKNKTAKIKLLKKRRAEIQKLRIQSRRSGAPADLRATGKDSDVLSGFGNVK